MRPAYGRACRAYADIVEERQAVEVAAAETGFRLGFVPGVTPAKWARTWQQRHPRTPLQLVPVPASAAEAALAAGELDAALMRPPVDRAVLHAIVLYAEEPVVMVARDHLLAALDDDEAVEPSDLADEVMLQPADDVLAWAGAPGAADDALIVPGRRPVEVPATTADAVALVAAGIGVLVVPRSLARLHHRKDVTARPLAGGPQAPVALCWVIEREDDRTEDLVGIVRGRTVNSSRGRSEKATVSTPAPAAAGKDRRRSAQRTGRPRGRGSRRR